MRLLYQLAFCSLIYLLVFYSLNAQDNDDGRPADWVIEAEKLSRESLFQAAIEKLQKALSHYRSLEDQIKIVHCQIQISKNQRGLGDFEAALSRSEDALALALQHLPQNHVEIGNCYNAIGLAHRSLGQYELALQFLEKANVLHEKRGIKDLNFIESLSSMAVIKMNLGQYESALEIQNRAITMALSMEERDSFKISLLYDELALIHSEMGDYDLALSFHLQSLNLKKNLFDREHLELATNFNNLGVVYYRMGAYHDARVNWLRSLKLRRLNLPSKHPHIGESLNNLGLVYNYLGKNDSALVYLSECLDLRKEILPHTHMRIGGTYNNLGMVYQDLNQKGKALDYYQLSVNVKLRHLDENSPSLANSYINMGLLFNEMGDHNRAIEYLNKSLMVLLSMVPSDHPYVGMVHQNLAASYLSQNKMALALNHAQKSVGILESTTEPNEFALGSSLQMLSGTWFELDSLHHAMASAKRSLEIFDKNLDGTHPSLLLTKIHISKILYQLGNIDRSSKILQDINLADADSSFLVSLRILQMNYQLMLNHKKMYLETANSDRLEKLLIYCDALEEMLLVLQRSHVEQGDLVLFNDSENEISASLVETFYWLWTRHQKYEFLNKAYQWSERSKQQATISALIANRVIRESHVPEGLILQESALRSRIAALRTSASERKGMNNGVDADLIVELRQEHLDLLAQLKRDYPGYDQLDGQAEKLNLRDEMEKLSINSARIEYFESAAAILSFVISRDTCVMLKLPKPKNWNAVLAEFNKASSDPVFVFHEDSSRFVWESFTSSARKLYDWLLGTQLTHLTDDVTHLKIVPHGVIHSLPFEILLLPETFTSRSFRDLPFVQNKYSISYASSMSLVYEVNKVGRKKNPINYGGFAPNYQLNEMTLEDSLTYNLVSNKSYTSIVLRNGIQDLPFARKNVLALSKRLGGQAFIGGEATLQAFAENANKFKAIHLAMHGFIDEDYPSYSKLLFSAEEGNKDSSLLNIGDLYHMNLSADLAVLSACNTGTGKHYEGEGPISFSRAFTFAGIPSVVMSLWSVPDVQTADVMSRFFNNLKENQPKDAALRNAKLAYLKNAPASATHPIYWAGFVATGDMSVLDLSSPSTWKYILGIMTVLLIIAFYFAGQAGLFKAKV